MRLKKTWVKVRYSAAIVALGIALAYCLWNVSAMGAMSLIILPSLTIATIFCAIGLINGMFPPEPIAMPNDVHKMHPERMEHVDASEMPPCVKKR